MPARAGPRSVPGFVIGLGMPGETILECGAEEQKPRCLPKMLRGEEIWCQLFSEPASIRNASTARPSCPSAGRA